MVSPMKVSPPNSPSDAKRHLHSHPSVHRPRFAHPVSRVIIPVPLLALLVAIILAFVAFLHARNAPFPSISGPWLYSPKHKHPTGPPSENHQEPKHQQHSTSETKHITPNASSASHPSLPLPDPATRLLLFTDMWERMVNMQNALAALLLHSIERNFTIVEPFIYESHAINEFALPELFQQQGLSPQPASVYFDLSPFFKEHRLITHDTLRQRVRVTNESQDTFVVQAAVWVPWDEEEHVHRGRSFYWCDDIFDQLQWKWEKSRYGRAIVPAFQVQRLLCLNPFHTTRKGSVKKQASVSLFEDLFAFVKAGTRPLKRECKECISIMFINYRKHLFSGIEPTPNRQKLIKNKYPSILTGKKQQELAKRVARESLGGKKYVGVQFRTGKASALLRRHAVFTNSNEAVERFEGWLTTCTESLVKEAKTQAAEMGENVGFFLASDMLNSGWKGGDIGSPEIEAMLNTSVSYFKRELPDLAWFEPDKYDVKQDVMGISAVVDAGVMYFSDAFVYALPSSFGVWVDEQRGRHNRPKAKVVDCMIPEFDEAEQWAKERRLRGR